MRPDIAAIRKRAEAATAGPWEVGHGPYGWDDGIIQAGGGQAILTNSGHGSTSASDEDAEFIAAARTDVPALCDYVERLEAVLAWRAGEIGQETVERICGGKYMPNLIIGQVIMAAKERLK